MKLAVDFLEAPAQSLGVLRHLECRNSYAASIGCLTWHIENLRSEVSIDRRLVGRHVCTLTYTPAAVLDELLRILTVDLVLGCAWKCDVTLYAPWTLTLVVLGTWNAVCVLLDSRSLDLLDLAENLEVDAVRIIDIAVGVRAGDNLRTELLCLLDRILCDITRTRNDDGLSLQLLAGTLHHLIGDVNKAIAGCLRTSEGTTEGETLTSQYALIEAGQSLILAIHITYLTSADTDITGRNVGILTDILVELGHEALAETHHLCIGLAVRVEVSATLAATDRKAGQGVLQNLLHAEELKDGLVYRRMETETALVRSDG